jgi:hypothetical protein
MTFALVVVAGFVAGRVAAKPWILAIPIIIAAIYILLAAAGRWSATDSPVPFALIVAEASIAFGVLSHRVRLRHTSR